MLECFKASECEVSEQRVDMLLHVFELCGSGREKFGFIEKAVKWTKVTPTASSGSSSSASSSSCSPYVRSIGHTRLHLHAGIAAWMEGLFGRAQNHLVFCDGEGRRLCELVSEGGGWISRGYSGEKDLFLLRLVLMLLAINDVRTADQVMDERRRGRTGQEEKGNEEEDDVIDSISLVEQFAYLLVSACKYKNCDFFNTVIRKYNLVLRRDGLFSKLTEQISANVFGKPVAKKSGFLSTLFGGANLEEDKQEEEVSEEDGEFDIL
eukprot:GHVS01008813.1.p1 GENE.GHVS01008813.1~~GHVS01008813.1.p1  ORF type:complete len:311 (-),score=67.26 GHVS01008813.1:42-836(-)